MMSILCLTDQFAVKKKGDSYESITVRRRQMFWLVLKRGNQVEIDQQLILQHLSFRQFLGCGTPTHFVTTITKRKNGCTVNAGLGTKKTIKTSCTVHAQSRLHIVDNG